MKVTSREIRVCRNTREAMGDTEMRAGGKSTFDFPVATLKTDEGIERTSFGFAGRGAEMAGQIAAPVLKPFLLGKKPLARRSIGGNFEPAIAGGDPFQFMPAERLTSVLHLEIVNLRCCGAISNGGLFEVLYPTSYMDFGMKNKIDIDGEGHARPPQSPRIGVDFDCDFIDSCTIQKLRPKAEPRGRPN